MNKRHWVVREFGRYDVWDIPAIPNDRNGAIEQAKEEYNHLSIYDKQHRTIEACLVPIDEGSADVYQVAWSSEQC